MRRSADDRGQVTPLLAAGVALTVVILLSLGPVGRVLTDRTQARTAADAAALAGAAEDRAAAVEMARANGAELVSFTRRGDEVVVKVEVDGVAAYGRARRYGTPARQAPSAAQGSSAGLAPSMVAAIARAEGLLGRPVPIASGYRSPAAQQALWDRRASNPYPVARPGSSKHERGLAIDVPRAFVDDLLAVAGEAGLCQPLPRTDPVHFEVCAP